MTSRERASLVAGAVVFLLGGLDAYLVANYLVAVPSIAMATCNLLAIRLLPRASDAVQLGLFVLNAALAMLTAYSTYAAGKQWLPYAWGLAAVVFLIVGATKHGRGALSTSWSR